MNISKNNQIPKSGLNFLFDEKNNLNERFLLLWVLKDLKNFYVRFDILEKLFIKKLLKKVRMESLK